MFPSFNIWNPNRAPLFWLRFYLYSLTFRLHYRLPSNFTFLKPGLEMKVALEKAEQVGAKQYFMGAEFDPVTWKRLYHETRQNVPQYFISKFQYFSHNKWRNERFTAIQQMHTTEPSQFAEKCLDPYLVNWFISDMSIFFPSFKRIFVDQRDEDLFKMIDKCPEKKIVVVVNQWHMEGIEHSWAHRYGQMPRSVAFHEEIDPIGDMDLRAGLFERLYNALHREIASANSKSTPSTYADWIIGYHRESNWQFEHRDM
jgi:hypothetical protein